MQDGIKKSAFNRLNFKGMPADIEILRTVGKDVNEVMSSLKRYIDVTTYAYDMENFRAEVEVAVSNVFFSWVFGFGGKVRINGPKEVKEQYKKMVIKAAEEY